MPNTTPLTDIHHARPDVLATRLGYLGLLPLIVCTLFIWLLIDRLDPDPFHFLVQALSTYAALVISFLGGLLWGLVMWRSVAGHRATTAEHRALWVGVLYTTLAWIAVLMPAHAGLAVQGFVLIGCYLSDRKLYPLLGAAGWLTLRFRLTIVSSLCCFLAAAQL